jgi:hypothetical protein
MTRGGSLLRPARAGLRDLRRRPATAVAVVLLAMLAGGAVAAPRPAPGHAVRVEYRDPGSPPTRGPAHALVTIEVFFVPGPNLPTAMLRLVQQLYERHPARIRVVYRVLKSGSAQLVPSAALEAHAEGKFFELMDELARQRTALKKEELYELARKIGADAQRVAVAIQLDRYHDVLDANMRRFERLHAGGPPSLLFNARPVKTAIGQLSPSDLDREYEAAYDRAIDKIERGVAVADLPAAFDDEAMSGTQPAVTSTSMADDETDRFSLEHRLASPPLRLGGLPSFGRPGVATAVPLAVLCRPNDSMCGTLVRVVEAETRLHPDEVRVVWAPWFDVGRDDAADLTLLGDAALCAEAIGSHQGELTPSPGWVWVKEVYAQLSKSTGKRVTADKLIDNVATKLDVDIRALSACRATMASTTLTWIAAARRSGVPRTGSAVAIGGRIYAGLVDPQLIRQLVEAELAPGVLGSLPRWHTGK